MASASDNALSTTDCVACACALSPATKYCSPKLAIVAENHQLKRTPLYTSPGLPRQCPLRLINLALAFVFAFVVLLTLALAFALMLLLSSFPVAFRLSGYLQDGLTGWQPFAFDGTASGSATPVGLLSPHSHCLNVDNVHAYELLPTDNRVIDGGFETHVPLLLNVGTRPAENATYEVAAARVLGGWTVSRDATGAVAVEAELTRSSHWVLATQEWPSRKVSWCLDAPTCLTAANHTGLVSLTIS